MALKVTQEQAKALAEQFNLSLDSVMAGIRAATREDFMGQRLEGSEFVVEPWGEETGRSYDIKATGDKVLYLRTIQRWKDKKTGEVVTSPMRNPIMIPRERAAEFIGQIVKCLSDAKILDGYVFGKGKKMPQKEKSE